MVKVSYHAREQVKGLSPQEHRELQDVLSATEHSDLITEAVDSERFVTRFGRNKRAVWRKEGDDIVVVLAVVSK